MFDGIRYHGSVEQRVIGSFVINDKSHDHRLQAEEIADMARTASEASGKTLSDETIDRFVKVCMERADIDGVCIR